MICFKEIEIINMLHRLILLENTGTPDELAEKLHLSRRQVYNFIDELKYIGAKVIYSRSKHTFFYTNDFRMDIKVDYSIGDNKLQNTANTRITKYNGRGLD